MAACRGTISIPAGDEPQLREGVTHIDEPLQVLVEVRQVVFPLLVLSYELRLSLQKFLPLLLQRLSLGPLMVDPRYHQVILVGPGMLWVLGEELLRRYEG